MASGSRIELASAYVPIIPTMRGIQGNIERELTAGLIPAATRAGADVGATIADQTTRQISSKSRDIAGAFAGLGADLTKTFTKGFNIAGPMDSQMQGITGSIRNMTSAFKAGFQDAEAAASSFTGVAGSLGGKVSAAFAPALRPLQNLKSGFDDSKAAASDFTGSLGTFGGKIRSAFDQATQPINNLKSGFNDSKAAASDFSGFMGTVGGRIRSGLDIAGTGVNNLADKFSGIKGKVSGVFETGLTPIKNFKAGLEDARAAVDPLTGKMGSLGGKVAEIGEDFTRFRKKIGGTGKDIQDEFDTASKTSSDNMLGTFDGAFKKIPALIAGAGITTAMSQAFTGALEQSGMQQKITAQLGLSPEAAKQAGTAAGQLYTSGYGESMDEVYDATSAVMSSISSLQNGSSADIQKITGYAMNLADTFGIDVTDSVGAIGVMLNNGLVTDATQGFDLVTGAMQKVPAAFRGEMTDALTEYSKHFAGLGLDGEQAMTVLINASQQGGIGIDKMGDAVKEFQIRSTDMSKTTTGAYQAIGLNADDMTAKLLAGGDSAEDAFGQIITGLSNMDDPTAQSQAALALFGTQLEDMGVDQIPNFLNALDPAGDVYDQFGGKAEEVGDILHDTASNKLESFKRAIGQDFVNVAGGAITILEKIGGALSPVVNFLSDTIDYWGPFAAGIGIVGAAVGIWAGAQAILDMELITFAGVMGVITSPITLIIVGIGLLVGAVILAYNKIGWFRDMVDSAWAWIQQVTGVFVNWWTATAWPAILNVLQWIGDKFVWLYQTVILPVWGWITQTIGAFITWITTVAWPMLQVAIQAIGGFFTSLWTTYIVPAWTAIQLVIQTFLDWWNLTLVPTFQLAIQAIGGFFTWLYEFIIQPVWTAILMVITMAAAVLMTIWQGIVFAIQSILAPIFTWLYEGIILPVWNWITTVIQNFATWFGTVFMVFIQTEINGMMLIWNFLRDTVSAVWSWITTAIQNFANWFAQTISPYISAIIDGLKLAWQWLADKVSAVFSWIGDRIQAFSDWFSRTIAPYINAALDIIKQGFQWLSDKVSAIFGWITDKIRAFGDWFGGVFMAFINAEIDGMVKVWNFLKDTVGTVWDGISTVIRDAWNWISDHIFTPMGDYLQTTVVGFFEKARDGIGTAWEKIQDLVKAPIKFVIDTVINGGLVKNYNKLNDFWGGDDMAEVSTGFARGGIIPGYQSQKKDEVLTPMRKGEGVLVPEATRALGADFIHGINSAANTGGLVGARSWVNARLKNTHGVDGVAAGHDHGAHANWAGGEVYTNGQPPSGSSGIWGALQQQASAAGAMSFPKTTVLGVSTEEAAKAWMGRSALNVNTEGKGPSVHVSAGGQGPWGFTNGADVTVHPSTPSNYRFAVMMHEFGHALSLHHTNSTDSLMHPSVAGPKQPSAMDYAALVSAWGKPGEGAKTYDVNGGSGGGGVMSKVAEWLTSPIKGLIDTATSKFSTNKFVGAPVGMAKKSVDDVVSWITKEHGSTDTEYDSGGGAEQWRSTVKEALDRTGLPVRDDYVNAWLAQIQSESGGNPNAVQGGYTDINTLTGDLAEGLVQVIGATFAAYRDKSLPDDRKNPLANLVAAMNYAKARYGTSDMLGVIGHGHGYALGGIVGASAPALYDNGGLIHRGLQVIDHQRSTPDVVLTDTQWANISKLAQQTITNTRGGVHVEGDLVAADPDKMIRKMQTMQKDREALAIG